MRQLRSIGEVPGRAWNEMRIFGTISEAGTGRAIGNLIVRAYHRDLLSDESLGCANTREDGSFEIRTEGAESATSERNSGLFLRVLDPRAEHEIYDTLGSLRRCIGGDEEFDISVPPENLGRRFEGRDRPADTPGTPGTPDTPDTPREFMQTLAALGPRIFATPLLVLLNIAAFGWLVAQGASPLAPSVSVLVERGANLGLRTLDGEWWRLVSCLFLHGGIVHLFLNCYVLWMAGSVVERLVGTASFVALYLASGTLASLASVAWNPLAASVGASGAIFGVWGALLGYALRQHDPVTLRGLRRLRNIALVFLGANLLFGLTQEHVDLAAHLGGLVAGFGAGLILSQPLSLETPAKRGPRLALLCAIALVLSIGIAAALPRRVIEIQKELERFDRTQIELQRKFSEALAGEAGPSIAEMRALLENELLPAWNAARGRVEDLVGLPPLIEAPVEEALEQARRLEAEWRTLAGDLGRFEDAVVQLRELEDRAGDRYERALAGARAGILSSDEFVEVLDREVLSEWEAERKLEGLEHLREPLQTLVLHLRTYADTRWKAWRLYVEAVRTGNDDLALASAEEHLRADEMIARWPSISVDSEKPAVP